MRTQRSTELLLTGFLTWEATDSLHLSLQDPFSRVFMIDGYAGHQRPIMACAFACVIPCINRFSEEEEHFTLQQLASVSIEHQRAFSEPQAILLCSIHLSVLVIITRPRPAAASGLHKEYQPRCSELLIYI